MGYFNSPPSIARYQVSNVCILTTTLSSTMSTVPLMKVNSMAIERVSKTIILHHGFCVCFFVTSESADIMISSIMYPLIRRRKKATHYWDWKYYMRFKRLTGTSACRIGWRGLPCTPHSSYYALYKCSLLLLLLLTKNIPG